MIYLIVENCVENAKPTLNEEVVNTIDFQNLVLKDTTLRVNMNTLPIIFSVLSNKYKNIIGLKYRECVDCCYLGFIIDKIKKVESIYICKLRIKPEKVYISGADNILFQEELLVSNIKTNDNTINIHLSKIIGKKDDYAPDMSHVEIEKMINDMEGRD